MLAAKAWGLTPQQWRHLSLDERAEMYQVFATEKTMQAIESHEANTPKGKI
jgi:hypothetical protein